MRFSQRESRPFSAIYDSGRAKSWLLLRRNLAHVGSRNFADVRENCADVRETCAGRAKIWPRSVPGIVRICGKTVRQCGYLAPTEQKLGPGRFRELFGCAGNLCGCAETVRLCGDLAPVGLKFGPGRFLELRGCAGNLRGCAGNLRRVRKFGAGRAKIPRSVPGIARMCGKPARRCGNLAPVGVGNCAVVPKSRHLVQIN